jgi:hypothetical protein
MRQIGDALGRAVGAAVALALSWTAAEACACCTSPGQRLVTTQSIPAARLSELQELGFDRTAELYLGEADLDSVRGIATPSARYDMTVTSGPGGLTFGFRDKAGRTGTLVLAWPRTMSVFEVDPRDETSDQGLGPTLYKEWKLTANASGTGVFAPGTGTRQRITLILQGRGKGCTDASHFKAWTLVVHGPAAEYTLFGTLK